MSTVTNVIVTGPFDSAFEAFNDYIKQHHYSGTGLSCINEIDVGGNKRLEAEVWIGAFNNLDLTIIKSAFDKAKFKYPHNVRIHVQRQQDDHFWGYGTCSGALMDMGPVNA